MSFSTHLDTFNSKVTELIKSGQNEFGKLSLEDFIENYIEKEGNLLPVFSLYQDLFAGFGTPNNSTDFYEKLNRLEENSSGDVQLNESIRQFRKTESNWDEFAENLDSKFPRMPQLPVGNLSLRDLENERDVGLTELCSKSPFTWMVFLRYLA